MQRTRSGRKSTTDPRAAAGPGRAKQRAVCIASLPTGEDFAELEELLRTAGVAVVGTLVQHRQNPHPNTYLGPGKLVELADYAKACDANVIACDDELSPRQERNLEQELGIAVVDRTTVILDIFAAHAGSAEGKLQVELAQLEYNLARMRGLWTHLERLGGGIGTRGPGETQIETDRRLARDRIAALRRRLAGVQSSREVMRAERSRARLPELALAGYTNTGKSTLLGALTGAPVPVADRLFHTLDPMTRTLRINGRAYLATDTVGFIRKLPHQLVDAFGATLEETRRAALIVHVADASATDDELEAMKRSVEEVLDEIGAGEQARILVLNKIDLLDPDRLTQVRNGNRDAMLVSSITGEGVDDLRDRIEEEFLRTLRQVDLLVPYSDGADLAELHDLAGELNREDTPDGVRISALLPPAAADRFARYAVTTPVATDEQVEAADVVERTGALDAAEPVKALEARSRKPTQHNGSIPQIKVARLRPDAVLPTRAYAGDAGFDLYAVEPARLEPGMRVQVSTGIAVEIPPGRAGLVLPRSGLAAKHGITLVNAPGLIDSGYRGELRVLLLNTDPTQTFELATGDRIAQLVVIDVLSTELDEVDALDSSERAERGFGSSG